MDLGGNRTPFSRPSTTYASRAAVRQRFRKVLYCSNVLENIADKWQYSTSGVTSVGVSILKRFSLTNIETNLFSVP